MDDVVKPEGLKPPEKVKAKNKSPQRKSGKKVVGLKSNDVGLGAKGKAWTFPKSTLEDAIRIPKALDEKFGGNPAPASDLAKAVGFNQADDWRFKDLLKSANLYGLVVGTGASATVSLAQLGQDIIAPRTPAQRSKALIEAFRTVEDFKKVDDYYGGKRIPEDEFFSNTLTREFKIPKDRVDAFSDTFLGNLKFLRSFSPTTIMPKELGTIALGQNSGPELLTAGLLTTDSTDGSSSDARVREFLDTCFVMMPFGEWQDRYYREIYVHAIKDAGLEPVRGDELYHTGSVVEQIWEQIEKAKILVADLSGRNPNVFYELGLAHAAAKPVIFTAANIDDVPFDLRHLRVIVYDIREPNWGVKLKQNMTDYLRNAVREPSKSIPSPFRKSGEKGSEGGD